MKKERKQIKAEAKGLLHRSKVSPYGITLVFLAVDFILTGISAVVSGSYIEDVEHFASLLQIELPTLPTLIALPGIVTTFISLAITLFLTVFSQGYTLYHLGIRRGEEKGYGTLLDGFSFVGKIILLFILLNLIIIGGCLLFVIPGIIFSYRYSFAFYNLCENPEMKVMDALRMSAQQTRGYKWRLFVLDLSFIGWYILSALTLNILDIWITPWTEQCHIAYYDMSRCPAGASRPSQDDPAPDGNEL